MKKISLFSVLFALCISTFAQTITLIFSGRDANNKYVQLNRVIVTNLSQNWQETLYWPDTTLTLNNGVGVNNYDTPMGFKLFQNNPNPFNGTTDASLTTVVAGSVALEITDVNGRAVENRNYTSLPAGTHHFRITLSAAGTYIMTARQNGKTSSIKMINNGCGGENLITQLEHATGEITVKSGDGTKNNVTHPWAYGDNLMILGYATICGTECTKQFSRQLLYNETIKINFSEHITTATVAASNVSNITSNSVSVNSSVSGNCGVTSRGFCYGTSGSPTISGQHTSNGSGTGSFTSSITGLTAGTTYYVRAYATNSAGTAYGGQRSFTTSANPPTVTTNTVSNITATSATCGGNVTATGGATVTARGVCWSTSQNPTVSNSHTTDGSGTGSFTSSIAGLTAGTTYYVRAYATNSAGTAYGSQMSFTTPQISFTCGTSTVTDYDGNTYNTVQIGNQCWMKENLRTTHYADGTAIPAGGSSTSETNPYYYNNSSSGIALTSRGYLYNWKAAMHSAISSSANPSGVQGICPNGWHLPSDGEWTQLTNYLIQSQYVCGSNSSHIAKALASTTGWSNSSNTCAVGNDQTVNNATGFSVVPAGGCAGSSFDNAGNNASFWSSTQYDGSDAYFRYMAFNMAYVDRRKYYKNRGFAVRCLCDGGGTASLPTVTTNTVSNITSTTATCGGNVTADGGATVTARGVCWSTSQNPTVINSHTTNGSGTGSFTSSITLLTAGITYYVRAYATNSVGTAYGSQVSFTTTQTSFTCGTSTLTDIDGNVYNTVQIGQQCWMKENLRTTHYANGTAIPAGGSSTSETNPYYYNNSSSGIALTSRGYLYNWKAATMVCPTGWHLPSSSEWTQLTNYVSSQSQYWCSNSSTYIAKALASTTGWNTYSGTCAVGNTSSTNNATGFSAVPAGGCVGSSFYSAGSNAYFWSSSYDAYYLFLQYAAPTVGSSNGDKSKGFSVRCLRD